jgi:hypothetical protein
MDLTKMGKNFLQQTKSFSINFHILLLFRWNFQRETKHFIVQNFSKVLSERWWESTDFENHNEKSIHNSLWKINIEKPNLDLDCVSYCWHSRTHSTELCSL